MATIQSEIPAPTLAPAPVRAWRAFWNIIRQLAARPLSLLGLIIVTLFLLMAIFGPMIAPYPFDAAIKGAARQPPSTQYLFGVDRSGRDVFSRVLWGARDIITLPLLTSILAVIF